MNLKNIIQKSLEEDIYFGDITTENLDIAKNTITAILVAKEKGILAGNFIFQQVFQEVDDKITIKSNKKDGDLLSKGDEIAKIKGNAVSILKAERVALNFLQRMSGIATLTNKFVQKIEGYKARLLDTRKTTPLLRILEKEAVRIGGGYNHRFGLFDMIMLKENHIRAVGSIKEAVKQIRLSDTAHKIEVEVTNLKELHEAYLAKADRAMLDNMSISEMKQAVNQYEDKIELEASGNININNIKEVAATGVDFISSGSLTHSYKSLDISLLFKE